MYTPAQGGEGTPYFKWRGWSNGGKNKNTKGSLGLPTKPKEIPGPKINPLKIPMANIRVIKISRKQIGCTLFNYTTTSNVRKKIPESKISNPENSFENPYYMKSEVTSLWPMHKRKSHLTTSKQATFIILHWRKPSIYPAKA